MSIFGHDNKLNIIASYNFFDAIKDNIIVPFKYYLVQSDNSEEDPSHKFRIFDNKMKGIIETLPFKKIILWMRTGDDLVEWAKHLVKTYGNDPNYLLVPRLIKNMWSRDN